MITREQVADPQPGDVVSAVHTVTWHLDGPGGHAWATFACTAPVGAECRLWCAAGCEEYCTDPEEHGTADHGACLFTEWMDAEGSGAELYNGPETSPSNGPIEYTWDHLDEVYEWHYVDGETGQVVPS